MSLIDAKILSYTIDENGFKNAKVRVYSGELERVQDYEGNWDTKFVRKSILQDLNMGIGANEDVSVLTENIDSTITDRSNVERASALTSSQASIVDSSAGGFDSVFPDEAVTPNDEEEVDMFAFIGTDCGTMRTCFSLCRRDFDGEDRSECLQRVRDYFQNN